MFYVISTQILNDGTKPCSIQAFEDKNVAESNFHSTNASNYLAQNLVSYACLVVDDFGNQIFKKFSTDESVNDTFYLVSIQETESGNPCSINVYANEKEALSAMESTLASNCISETLLSSACFVLNKIGGKIDGGYTKKEEPAPEPNED